MKGIRKITGENSEIFDQILAYLLSNKIIFLESDKDEVLEKLKVDQDRLKLNKINENQKGSSNYTKN